ncbi:MAG TPA: HNH endonuclease [Allosphingosinicella sp.]
MSEEAPPPCFLCGRPLGTKTEWHHPVPKSRGGRETVPVHPVCHRAIHRALDNKSLARDYASAAALRAHPELARFIEWVARKDPDFHVPTRRGRK